MRARFTTFALMLIGLSATGQNVHACDRPPNVVLKMREHVVLGRTVVLDGSESDDPDEHGGIVRYEWDFDGDDNYDYFETADYHPDGAFDGITTHVFTASGSCTVKFRAVDDADNWSNSFDVFVTVGPDTDGDEMPDSWEGLYELDPYNPADAPANADSPGGSEYSNLCEYLHRTNPTDSGSEPEGSDYNITLYVPGEIGYIQHAIDGSIDGDTVVVAQGVYYENVDFGAKEVTLTSTNPENPHVVAATILDGRGLGSVVKFENVGGGAALSGFTITGGNSTSGGGIYCEGASPTISNCVITGNDAADEGGGIYNLNGSGIITECVFSNNTAQMGGGMYNEGSNSSAELINCVFAGNTAYYGGAMRNSDYSTCTVVNCTFSRNTATWEGGGINIQYNAGVTVTNSILWGNISVNQCQNDEIYCGGSCTEAVSYCVIEPGGYSGNGSGYMSDQLPEFINPDNPAGDDDVFGTLDDGLLVWIQGPCIDVGDPTVAPLKDVTGRVRLDVPYREDSPDCYHDIGAYESPVIWFVDKTPPDNGNDGTSWENAYYEVYVSVNRGCGGLWWFCRHGEESALAKLERT